MLNYILAQLVTKPRTVITNYKGDNISCESQLTF